MKRGEETDMFENELVKINSLADILTVVEPADLDRNTLACLGGMIREAAGKLWELFMGKWEGN